MGKKKGKKTTKTSETVPPEGSSGSGRASQGTPPAGPSSREAPSAQSGSAGQGSAQKQSGEMLSQKFPSLSVKGSDGAQGGSGGAQPQQPSERGFAGPAPKKPPQGGPPLQGAPSSQPPKSAWGQPRGKPSAQSGVDESKKKAADQPPKSQSAKENKPPKPKEQKPNAQGKQGEKSPSLQLLEIPARRTKGGTEGSKINLEVNLLRLNFSALCPQIIHYDVAFVPDRPKRLLREALDKFQRRHFPTFSVGFDGRCNLYASKRLPFGNHIEDNVTVINRERLTNNEINFTIHIKYAQTIQTNAVTKFMRGELNETPQTAIQAVDVVLRTALSNTPLVPVARSYYIPPSRNLRGPCDLGGGLELWHGFYQSAVLNWKPFLNIDVAHKGFPKPILLTRLLENVCNLDLRSLNQPLFADQERTFKGFITTLKVRYEVDTVPNSTRTHRINNLGRSARDYVFESNGSRINIVDYYRREKHYNIKYPYLPTVQVDPARKEIFLPMELCTVLPGQALNRKLDQFQTRAMIREAAKRPSDRKERIVNAIRNARYNESPVVQEFGIDVSNKFEQVPARVLDPPLIVYRNERTCKPSNGAWGSGEFLTSNNLKNWVILNLENRMQRPTLDSFSRMLIKQANDQGMLIAPVMEVRNMDTRGQFQTALKNCFNDWKRKNVELVVVVLPPFNDIYGKVKQTAELQVGILTQCVRSQTLRNERGFSSVCENLVKKMNAKRNGMNHKLSGAGRPWPKVLASVFTEPVMFVGIDVTHPSPDQNSIPSVAAISASHDNTALFKYNMVWRLQPPRVEIIQDLKNVMKEQLLVFYRETNGLKPHKIIVYRDGVSEGQFQQVLTHELTAIRAACKEIQWDGYEPGVSFLVVQKRHHVRFFPTEEADSKGNVFPGTIVDTQITHPREFDFFLASHASLQGTSRPTKYHLLWNDNADISEDDFQVLTFYLCHLFARCTRSVSYPAPTYYAHLAAFRARVYLENNRLNVNEPGALARFQERFRIDPAFQAASPMFFV